MKSNTAEKEKSDIPECYPAALTIAGSDCGGGAGIQADLRTFSAFGVYGCSVITALTAQNPHKVAGIFPSTPEFVSLQIKTVLEDFEIKAIKTGMLYSGEIISAISEALKDWTGPLVIDPVMISTSGHPLLKEDARNVLMKELLPRAAWITPNLPEAEVLAGIAIHSDEDRLRAARICAEKFGCGIILKGGHSERKSAEELVLSSPDAEPYCIAKERLELASLTSHGTGCTFSAALAALLAAGESSEQAVRCAKEFVYDSLISAVSPGRSISAMFPKGFRK